MTSRVLDPPATGASSPDDAAGEDTPAQRTGHHHTVRWASAAIAALLLIAAGALVFQHQPPTRTPQRFCRALSQARGATAVLASGDAAQITAAVRQLDRANRAAPRPVEAPMDVLVRYADGLGAAVARGGDPDTALEAAVRQQAGQAAAVEQAGRAVSAYARATCGFTL